MDKKANFAPPYKGRTFFNTFLKNRGIAQPG